MDSPFRQEPREPVFSLLSRIRRALEARDLEALADLFMEDATLEEVSSLNPPSHPLILHGREAILGRLREEILRDPVSGWSRNLSQSTLIEGLETDEGLAFTEQRVYVAGDRVIAQHFAHKYGGRIARHRMVVAWDAD